MRDDGSFVLGLLIASLGTCLFFAFTFSINDLEWYDGQRLKVLRSHITHIEKYEPCNPHNTKGLDDAMGIDCKEIHRARIKQ